MHCYLRIDEVLQGIADIFELENPKTLLHMSLTCRAFFDPAMNALWRTLPDSEYLIRVLPEYTRGSSTESLQFVSVQSA